MRFLLFFIFICSISHAKIEVYTPTDKLKVPVELDIILKTLNLHTIEAAELAKLESFINNYTIYAHNIERTHLFFAIKAELTKHILAQRFELPPKTLINLKSLERIEMEKKSADMSPLAQYVFYSILKDAKRVVSDPLLQTALSNSNTADQSMRILKRRVEMVFGWVAFFDSSTLPRINNYFKAEALKILDRIERSLWLFHEFSERTSVNPTASLFEKKSFEPRQSANSEKTVEQIIDKVVEPLVQQLPSPVNDWIPREFPSAPFRGSNIIKSKDPFYSAPENLPKPTNDWLLDL